MRNFTKIFVVLYKLHIFAAPTSNVKIMNKVSKKYFRLLGLLVAVVMTAHIESSAYSFMPLVTSYANQQSLCATQAWSAAQDSTGMLYFATSDGVLTYDGVRWKKVEAEGLINVRTVKNIGGRIYLGSYEQLGYLERDDYGETVFRSIKNLADDFVFHDDEFWDVIQFDKHIYFQSFRSLFEYDGNTIKTFYERDIAPLYLFSHNGHLYSQLIGKGLYEIKSMQFTEVASRADYKNSNIVAMLDCGDGSAMICTEEEGIFRLNPESRTIKPVITSIDNELKKHTINRACRMSDGSIVIGTISNGVYAITADGSLKWHYNLDNGLGNNSVLGLMEDSTGNVWVMMDHGISVIHSGLPYSLLMPHAGEPYIGMTYDMYRIADKLLICTNQGLYTYSYKDETIVNSGTSQTQIWHIESFDKQIMIGGGVESSQIMPDGHTMTKSMSSTDIKKGVIHNKEVLIETSYYDLRVYKQSDNATWVLSHCIKGFGSPIRQLEIDADGSLWCSHMAQGVIHLELTSDLDSVCKVDKIRSIADGRRLSTSFVMKIRGQIVISDGDSLYCYNHNLHKLTAMSDFHNDLPTIRDVYRSTAVDDNRFWLSTRKSYSLISYENGHYRRQLTIPLDLLSLQSNGVNNNVYVDEHGNCYFAVNNGVGCVPMTAVSKPTASMSIASVESVDANGNTEFKKINNDDKEPVEVPGNISFKIRYPSYNLTTPRFVYTLEGAQKQFQTTDQPRISYVGLEHGSYTFHATMIDDLGNPISHVKYDFVVPVPLHLTYWAKALYALLLGGAIAAFTKIYTRRQVNRQRREHEIERVSQNVKILEQERIISEQQKQLLQNELSAKSKELASMALEASYKHQVIENLKESIGGQRRMGILESKEIDSLIKTINSDIGDNEFWDIFHNNFDLIHENFFRNLRKQFPALTPIDMKFCALLRLNMSTKDIAKFTHLTIRGVETARYRLRRKLGLDSKVSIVQFLIDFK